MTFQNIYNQFYQALTILAEYETKEASGVGASPHFALSRATNLFIAAMKQGDCYAPHFLYYLANKYNSVDSDLLPSLNIIPQHKFEGKKWVNSYIRYLELLDLLNEFPENKVIVTSNKRQSQTTINLYNCRVKKYEKQLAELAQDTTPIASLFTAKIMERSTHLGIALYTHEKIELFYNTSAAHPNIWGMVEYAKFLDRTARWDLTNNDHSKLRLELNLIKQSQGSFLPLYKHYETQKNPLYLSNWLLQGASHGELFLAFLFTLQYIEGKVKWRVPLSQEETLNEALLWIDLIFNHGQPEIIEQAGFWLVNACKHHVTAPKEYPIQKIIFLAYLTSKCTQYFMNNPSNMDLLTLELSSIDIGTILYCIWNHHSQSLPLHLNNDPMILSELALALEKNGHYELAEQYYRKALKLNPNLPLLQYNLANSLKTLNKNVDEQIGLFFLAANSGCHDSIYALFCIAIITERCSLIQLNELKEIINKLEPKVTVTIFETKTQIDRESLSTTLEYAITQKQRVLRHYFQMWRNTAQKEPVLELEAHSALPHQNSLKVELPVRSNHRVNEAGNARLKLDETIRKERALAKLQKLNDKNRKNLSLTDYVEAVKCHAEIFSLSSSKLSTKGRTSGSRFELNGRTFHANHGNDRMKPGAQLELKESIEEFTAEATRAMTLM